MGARMPNFTANQADSKLIRQIARRALDSIASLRAQQVFSIDVQMDLEMVHCNGCPLNLKALLKADELSFAKEIVGLRGHVNRNTGKLTGGFLPRFHLNLQSQEG